MSRALRIAGTLPAFACLLAAGCASEVGSARAALSPPASEDSAAGGPSGDALTVEGARTTDGEEVLLEERTDGARLFGRMLGGLVDTDEEPVWVVRTELAGQPVEPSMEGARVRDATFLDLPSGEGPSGGLLTIGEDHVLRAHVGGVVRELDAEALGPLSVAGAHVAYVRGTMPFYELAIADVAQGTSRVLTTDLAPVWSPAISPDGTEIVFVSGASGVPRLLSVREGGEPRILPESAAFPSSLGAPRFDGTTLTFEDESGQTHSLVVTP